MGCGISYRPFIKVGSNADLTRVLTTSAYHVFARGSRLRCFAYD